MAVDNGLIHGNVEIADLQRVVPVTIQRSSTTKLSGDIGTIACSVAGDSVPDDAGGSNWTVLARVDINRYESFCLIDYKIPAGLKRHLSRKCVMQLPFQTVMLENPNASVVPANFRFGSAGNLTRDFTHLVIAALIVDNY